MNVLAIDTSARGRSMAVIAGADGTRVAHRHFPGPASMGALIVALSELLREHGGEPMAVVVAVGPGSYTGVRAGMAAAMGVAQAGALPLHGIGSLSVVAHGAPPGVDTGVAVSAAGRDAIYLARFVRTELELRTDEPERLTHLEWAKRRPQAGAVVAFDRDAVDGVTIVAEPDRALASAVPQALARPALTLIGLAAHHVAVPGSDW